jgi:predicted CXXCH cytochrome family protein
MTFPVVDLFQCSDCHQTFSAGKKEFVKDPITHDMVCYNCHAEREEALMVNQNKIILYLVNEGEEMRVQNYSGTLHFKVLNSHISKNNLNVPRTDVWFIGPDGKTWHGFRYGVHELLRCNKPKHQKKHLMSLCKCDYRTNFKYE